MSITYLNCACGYSISNTDQLLQQQQPSASTSHLITHKLLRIHISDINVKKKTEEKNNNNNNPRG